MLDSLIFAACGAPAVSQTGEGESDRELTKTLTAQRYPCWQIQNRWHIFLASALPPPCARIMSTSRPAGQGGNVEYLNIDSSYIVDTELRQWARGIQPARGDAGGQPVTDPLVDA